MPHSPQEWAASVRGTPSIEQLHIAVDTSKTPPREFLLKPGQAHVAVPGDPDTRTLQRRTNEGQFHCLIDGCGPFMTAVAGPETRDHFRHRVRPTGQNKAAHKPESLWHQTGKHHLASWLQDCLGPQLIRLEIDTHQVETPSGRFKPDVYAELESGARIAIEYQYSPGDVEVMTNKRRGYQEAGIIDWWFYSPWPQTCKLRKPVAEDDKVLEVDLIATQQNQTLLGRFYWYNPLTETVGTPFRVARSFFPARPDEWWGDVDRKTSTSRRKRPWPAAPWVSIHLDPLSYCTVNPSTGQFSSPTDRDLDREERRTANEIEGLREGARQRAVTRTTTATSAERPSSSNDLDIEASKPQAIQQADREDPEPTGWVEGAADGEPSVVADGRPDPAAPRRPGIWAALRRLLGW
jgi:hypothetical protein